MVTETEIRKTLQGFCINFLQMSIKDECMFYHWGTGHLCSLRDTDHICHVEYAVEEMMKLPEPEKFGKGGHSDGDTPPPMSRGV